MVQSEQRTLGTPRFEAFFAESPGARAEVNAFVATVYRSEYGADPPLADAYAAVTFCGNLVCCAGIDWPGPDGRLVTERAYGIERAKICPPFTGVAQLGRWASNTPKAGGLALYAAAVFALERGVTIALGEISELGRQHCTRLGLRFHDVPHSELDLTQIPEVARPTYAKRDMRPFLLEFSQVRSALHGYAAGLSLRK